jgi:flagellar hook-length control protein FliK
MSTAINSTHQQDRVAQQKLVNARQHASAQGQQQGAAFAQMLSLACDEDTDLDALQVGGKLFGLKADDKGETADAGSPAKRKSEKGLAAGSDSTDTDGLPESLHPTAQANATLLALLAQAQGAQADAAAPSTDQTAAALPVDTQATAVATDVVADTLPADVALPPTATPSPAQPATAETAEKTVPGKAVRELARQLGAAMNNTSNAQDSTAQGRDNGVAWGRQPAAESATVLAQAASGLEAASGQLASSSRHDTPALAAHARPAVAGSEPGAPSDGPEATAEGAAAPTAVRPAGSDGQSPTGLGGETLGGTEQAERAPTAEEAGNAAEQWRDQWAEAMDQMSQQVSYWVSQGGVRQATLRVGNGWQQAMDVKLSMKNGQAHIEFQTDHEAARSAIADGGTEVLRDMLAQSGIDLGQVSIGAQASGGDAHPQAQGQAGAPGQRMAPASDAPAATALQPRHSHSTGLDVYV